MGPVIFSNAMWVVARGAAVKWAHADEGMWMAICSAIVVGFCCGERCWWSRNNIAIAEMVNFLIKWECLSIFFFRFHNTVSTFSATRPRLIFFFLMMT